jgi:hypothetical protein
MMNKIILFLSIIIFWAGRSAAQQKPDPVAVAKDTVLDVSKIPPVSMAKANAVADTTPFVTPKKTGLFSAIVPGLGQYHNKQYWKIPVIYALVGASVYFLQDNIKNYNDFRIEYAGRLSPSPGFVSKFPQFDNNGQVKDAMDYYRKNLDLTVLFTALGYTLQIIDAVVFAHLKGFDMSEDISLNMRPVMTPQGGLGFGLVMNFK